MILHEAAIPSVARSVLEPRVTSDVNVDGTIEVMLAAARHNVKRVVFAGSSSVYGIPESLPCRETQLPAPTSPYGAAKIAGEHYVTTLGALSGVETVVLRYFNIFGPGQDPDSEYAAVVPKFVTAVLAGERPVINGDGSVSRDFTYVDNVVEANMLAARGNVPSRHHLQHRLREPLQPARAAQGDRRRPRPAGRAASSGRPARATSSTRRPTSRGPARRSATTVKVPFGEGIARTVAWYRAQARVAAG